VTPLGSINRPLGLSPGKRLGSLKSFPHAIGSRA